MLRTLGLLAGLALFAGCGPQPRFFQVTINGTALDNLPATCYASGTVPTATDKTTNTFAVQNWVVYDGDTNKLLLQLGSLSSLRLGDSAPVAIGTGEVIEGGPTTFTSVRTQVQAMRTTTTTITVTTTQFDSSLKGTLKLDSTTVCTGGGACTPNCTADFPFFGRKIEGSQNLTYVHAI